ncbi:MAG: pteridine reductase [Gammaproteobacteria bacterium]|nr:pteridine reductase [Gammaproteobacteria bacterium]
MTPDQPASAAPHRTARVVLITGGARRVGACIARDLHALGFDIAVHYRHSRNDAQSLASTLCAVRPDSVRCFQADLLSVAECASLVDKVRRSFGRLDVLINNASSFYPTPLGQISEAQFEDLIGSNLKAPLFVSQHAAPLLRASHGAIVNITDIHASRPKLGFSAYSAAKAGLASLTISLARELAPEVRVNAIAPGSVMWPEQDTDPEARRRIVAGTALGRPGNPQDIADAVRYLVTSAAYTTGQTLVVDGGRELGL